MWLKAKQSNGTSPNSNINKNNDWLSRNYELKFIKFDLRESNLLFEFIVVPFFFFQRGSGGRRQTAHIELIAMDAKFALINLCVLLLHGVAAYQDRK